MQKYFLYFSLLILSACSDKYESLFNSAPSPGLSFNKDTVTIREKDYTNVNQSGNGRLSFYCKSANNQMNIQVSSSSDKVHLMYRMQDLINGQSLPVMDSIIVFCVCDTAGIYTIDCVLTDRLGKVSEKQLIINCRANQAAVPSFFFYSLGRTMLQNWPYHFDASISNDPDGVITEYHFSVNGQSIVTTTPNMDWTFHAKGTHNIGLYVTDDLGKNSDTVYQQILIP